MNKVKLPKKIKVNVIKERGGVIFAELSEYGIFTEADTFQSLVFNVNDLVCSFFDVPEKLREKVWYNPPEALSRRFMETPIKKEQVEVRVDPVLFSVLSSSNTNNNFLFK